MPVVTGNLRDVTSVPLAHKEPEIIFSLNAANSSGGNLFPTYPISVTPDSAGNFYVNLESTVDMVDRGFYKMQIKFLAPSSVGTTLIDFPDWRITVPRDGGTITTLLAGHNPGNQSMVWVSLTPPIAPRPFTLWLEQDPTDTSAANTGRLYEFRNGSWSPSSGKGAFKYLADLKGPAGYSALGTEPQQQAVADWILGTAGPNPLSTAANDVVNGASVDSQTFMPTANVVFKLHPKGYRYEVVRVRCNGRPRPGILKKMYASDFEKTSPGGDQFVVPDGKQETVQSFAARSGADVVFNATGWQTAVGGTPPYMMVRGPQIKDGVIYRDFEPSSNRGRHCLGVHRDGRILPYMLEDGWSAQSMVDAGVVDTFTFGPLVVKDGIVRNAEADTWASSLTGGAISARTILGVTATHDVVLLTVVGVSADGTGVGGNNIGALAREEGCVHAILLDGGGSTQAVANGLTYHPSSDSDSVREIGDCGLIYARLTQTPDSALIQGVEPIKLASGYVANASTYTPGAVVRGGKVSLQGQVTPATGLFPANTWVVIGNVPDKARPKRELGAGAFFAGALGAAGQTGKIQVRAYGELSVQLPVETSYIDLSGANYDAF